MIGRWNLSAQICQCVQPTSAVASRDPTAYTIDWWAWPVVGAIDLVPVAGQHCTIMKLLNS
jgi:hypothetical protein